METEETKIIDITLSPDARVDEKELEKKSELQTTKR